MVVLPSSHVSADSVTIKEDGGHSIAFIIALIIIIILAIVGILYIFHKLAFARFVKKPLQGAKIKDFCLSKGIFLYKNFLSQSYCFFTVRELKYAQS